MILQDVARAPGYFGPLSFGETITVSGWILATAQAPLDRCALYVDGERIAETPAVAWPEAELPSYLPAGVATRFAFEGIRPPFAVRELARVEVVAFAGAQAVSRMGTFARRNLDALPTPPQHLMVRVTGNGDGAIVKAAGARCAKEFLDTLSRHRPLDSLRRVLDWGAGCGRVTMHLLDALAPYPAVVVEGADIDAEAIAWANANVRGGAFAAIQPHPPLPWPDATFDAVFACSVFTHLTRDAQEEWLAEMQRVIAPGGLLLASIFPSEADIEDDVHDPVLDEIAPAGYYRFTRQSRAFVTREWSRWFDVAEFVEHGLEGVQHLVVLRRRAGDVPVRSIAVATPEAPRPGDPSAFPAGHFYSPVPNWKEVARDAKRLFRAGRPLHGIDLRADEQLALFHELVQLYREVPYGRRDDLRYTLDNPNFGPGDAVILHLMIRHLRPRRIVEVGSGYSSCVMVDTNELFFDDAVDCTFIDPHPELLRSLLRRHDRVRVLGKRVQDVPDATFSALEANDILFIDSSHVLKTGSDLNHLLFEVLPLLRPGVAVHFHDIFFPFEYPQSWVLDLHLAWNELYALQAFLQYNSAFEIEFFNSFITAAHKELFRERMPLVMKNPGGSLWLRRR